MSTNSFKFDVLGRALHLLPAETAHAIALNAFEMGFAPVSYTHLVVYKRQTYGTATMVQTGQTTSDDYRTTTRNSNPVSYTHLDVYKRQVIPNVKTLLEYNMVDCDREMLFGAAIEIKVGKKIKK